MSVAKERRLARLKRQVRVRQKVAGTTERPRLCIFRSAKHIYAQIIEDTTGTTLAAVSTVTTTVSTDLKSTGNADAGLWKRVHLFK